MDDLKTVREAAKLLTLSPHTLRVWIQERRIESVRLGRVVRIPLAEIERLIEGGRTKAVPWSASLVDNSAIARAARRGQMRPTNGTNGEVKSN
jgi:excisionase family DNA binding protein|tara:strand:+ start:1050 stop:1328 length:279 start_codon:yes stop_codon:yes gene_type:complete